MLDLIFISSSNVHFILFDIMQLGITIYISFKYIANAYYKKGMRTMSSGQNHLKSKQNHLKIFVLLSEVVKIIEE